MIKSSSVRLSEPGGESERATEFGKKAISVLCTHTRHLLRANALNPLHIDIVTRFSEKIHNFVYISSRGGNKRRGKSKNINKCPSTLCFRSGSRQAEWIQSSCDRREKKVHMHAPNFFLDLNLESVVGVSYSCMCAVPSSISSIVKLSFACCCCITLIEPRRWWKRRADGVGQTLNATSSLANTFRMGSTSLLFLYGAARLLSTPPFPIPSQP